jgi:hypothetical protein
VRFSLAAVLEEVASRRQELRELLFVHGASEQADSTSSLEAYVEFMIRAEVITSHLLFAFAATFVHSL